MSEYCLYAKKSFDACAWIPVGWSSDKLPACPYCYKSMYEHDYEQTHSKHEDS